MIFKGEHGTVTTLKTRSGYRAKMHYKTPWSDKRHLLSAESSSKGKARRRLEIKWTEIREGWSDTPHDSRDFTLTHVLEAWYPTIGEVRGYGKKLSANTLEEYRDIIDHHIVPRIGDLTLAQLTAHRLEEAIRSMIDEKGVGKSNARHSLTVLKQALKYARKNEWMVKNPLENINTDGLYSKSKEPEALTTEEVNVVRCALAGWSSPRRRRSGPTSEYVLDVFEFLAGTGCRISEALGLHWEDVHFDSDRPWVRIHAAAIEPRKKGRPWIDRTKTDDIRELEIPPFLTETLKLRQDSHMDEILVFSTRNGNIIRRQSVARAIKRALENEGVDATLRDKVTHHAMRRTVATHLGAERAQKQLGHRHIAITRSHYIDRSHSHATYSDALQAFGGQSVEHREPGAT